MNLRIPIKKYAVGVEILKHFFAGFVKGYVIGAITLLVVYSLWRWFQ